MHARTTTLPRSAAAMAAAVAALAGALVLAQPPQVVEAAPSGSCLATTALVNGDFEQPAIAAGGQAILPAASVPGWQTTDSGIELWSSGFLGVPSGSGAQFAEINANIAGMLYQDVTTTPGQTLSWSLLHRARSGTDVMEVLIGAPSGPLASQGPISDTTAAWGAHSGLYTVPAGQTTTRFAFNAVSTGSGSPSIGNFLDAVTFGNGSCLVVSTGMTNVTAPGVAPRVGDVLEYSVTVENQGGSPAVASSVTVPVPADLEYVPGSIAVTSGPGVGPRSDAAGDDPAESDGASVVVRVGSGATASAGGSIAPGTSTTAVFRAVVPPSAALSTVSIDPVVTSTDSLSGDTESTPAPQIDTPIPASADLVATLVASAASPVAGAGTVTFTGTVTNDGPQAATGAVVELAVPSALGGATVIIDGTACTITAGVATCPVGSLPVGGSRTVVLTGDVAASVPAGTVLGATISASATEHDPTAASASAAATVATSTALAIGAAADSLLVAPGDAVGVDLTVTSAGPSDAQDVAVAFTVPPGFTAVPSVGVIDLSTGAWLIGTLTPGTTATLRITGVATDLGTLAVDGTVTSSTGDADASDDVALASITVAAPLLPPVIVTPPAAPAVVPPVMPAAVITPAAQPAAESLAHTGTDGGTAAGWFALAMLAVGLLLVRTRRRLDARR